MSVVSQNNPFAKDAYVYFGVTLSGALPKTVILKFVYTLDTVGEF